MMTSKKPRRPPMANNEASSVAQRLCTCCHDNYIHSSHFYPDHQMSNKPKLKVKGRHTQFTISSIICPQPKGTRRNKISFKSSNFSPYPKTLVHSKPQRKQNVFHNDDDNFLDEKSFKSFLPVISRRLEFKCHLCPFMAAMLHDLDLHMMTHAGQKLVTDPDYGYLDDLQVANQSKIVLTNKRKEVSSPKMTKETEKKRASYSPDLIKFCPEICGHILLPNQSQPNHGITTVDSAEEKKSVQKMQNVQRYDCPFCEFFTENQSLFANHFNSHNLLYPTNVNI